MKTFLVVFFFAFMLSAAGYAQDAKSMKLVTEKKETLPKHCEVPDSKDDAKDMSKSEDKKDAGCCSHDSKTDVSDAGDVKMEVKKEIKVVQKKIVGEPKKDRTGGDYK